MSDAVSFAIPAHIAAAIQPLGASLSPPQTPASQPSDHINLSAPTYVNPAISFDPVTDIVFFADEQRPAGQPRNPGLTVRPAARSAAADR
jgi:hypothetical protein